MQKREQNLSINNLNDQIYALRKSENICADLQSAIKNIIIQMEEILLISYQDVEQIHLKIVNIISESKQALTKINEHPENIINASLHISLRAKEFIERNSPIKLTRNPEKQISPEKNMKFSDLPIFSPTQADSNRTERAEKNDKEKEDKQKETEIEEILNVEKLKEQNEKQILNEKENLKLSNWQKELIDKEKSLDIKQLEFEKMKSAFLEQLDNLKNKLNVEMGIQTENNDNEIKAKQEELAKLNLNLKDKIESYEKMKEEMEEFQKRTLMHSKEKEKFMMTLSLKRSEEEKIMEDRQNEINMKNEIIQSQLEILNIAFTLLPSTKKGTFKDNLIKHNNLMISNNYESMKNPESNQAIELNNNKNSFIHEILKESNEIRKQLKSKIYASQSL